MLKMFVWLNVLEDYTSGMIAVLAEDVDQARKIAMEKICSKTSFPGVLGELSEFGRTKVRKDLSKEPTEVHLEPAAAFVWGGS